MIVWFKILRKALAHRSTQTPLKANQTRLDLNAQFSYWAKIDFVHYPLPMRVLCSCQCEFLLALLEANGFLQFCSYWATWKAWKSVQFENSNTSNSTPKFAFPHTRVDNGPLRLRQVDDAAIHAHATCRRPSSFRFGWSNNCCHVGKTGSRCFSNIFPG